MNNYLFLLLLSIASGILYRLGGASKEDQDYEYPWIPRWFKNIPKKRDGLSNLLVCLGAFLMGVNAPLWGWGISFGLAWASYSSYWDWLFGYDNLWFHSFMISFSFLPLVIWGNLAVAPFVVRCLLNALVIGGLSTYLKHDRTEEESRGFLLCISNIIFGVLK